jgi:hypothetical protein
MKAADLLGFFEPDSDRFYAHSFSSRFDCAVDLASGRPLHSVGFQRASGGA